MQDEIWMRNWNEVQPRFRRDMDRGLGRIGAGIERLFGAPRPLDGRRPRASRP